MSRHLSLRVYLREGFTLDAGTANRLALSCTPLTLPGSA